MRWTTLRPAFVLACFSILTLASLGISCEVYAQTSAKVHFEIAAQPLDQSLKQFALQSKRQVIFDPASVPSKKAPAIVGDLTPEAALKALLEGSGLGFTVGKGDTLVIAPAATTRDSKDGRSSSSDASVEPSSPAVSEKAKSELTEIVVTGTHIAGEAPVGSSVIVYTREVIDQSGASTLDQFARTMAENFSNTDVVSNTLSNAQYSGSIAAATGNAYAGAAFNLHGIGPSATLTLLNGHRLASAGSDGSMVDISLIPLSAIDHIETLPDGASAIYGADAVAGIVNIVTRKTFDGAESAVRYGEATSGGASEVTASQLLGKSWGTGNVLLNYEYDDQRGLDASQRDYIAPQGGPYSLIPESHRNSVFLSGRQDVGADTKISVDVLYSDRQFLQRLTEISSVFSENFMQSGNARQSGITLTVAHSLLDDWHAELTGNYSKIQQKSPSETALVGIETIDDFNRTNSDDISVDILANGSLLSLPGGRIKVAVGATFREEKFETDLTVTIPPGEPSSTDVSAQRHVTSVYGELYLPLFGESNARNGFRRLELSAAARYDDYNDFGSTVNPRVGLLWEPTAGFDLRGSFGTSFTAPLLSQLHSPIQSNASPYPDSSSPSGLTNTLQTFGGNPHLIAEQSRSFTAGFDLKPEVLPRSSLSLSYFNLKFDNRISTPPTLGQANLGAPLLAPFITRNPPLSVVESYFNSPNFQGDYTGFGAAGISAIFNDQLQNIATTKESGIEMSALYSQPVAQGTLNFTLSAERLLQNKLQTIVAAPYVTLLNAFSEPPKWKGRSGVTWTDGGFTASMFINYVGSYQNSLITPPPSISSWTTGDLYFGYKTGETAPGYLFRNLTIALNIQNVTNAIPPFVQIPDVFLEPGQRYLPFDPANASPVGRFIALSVRKAW
jgi:iron complex outermembrane recepter protein